VAFEQFYLIIPWGVYIRGPPLGWLSGIRQVKPLGSVGLACGQPTPWNDEFFLMQDHPTSHDFRDIESDEQEKLNN
jgi:hypothetical protein